MLTLALSFILSVLTLTADAAPIGRKHVIGYIDTGYLKNASPDSLIPWDSITHAIISSLKISEDGRCLLEKAGSETRLVNFFTALKSEKLKHPSAKVMISIGTLKDAGNFSKNSMTPESRKKLAASCVEIVNRFDFDGIDVDWEYPVKAIRRADGSPKDRENFPLLIGEMRNQLGKVKLLTVATTAYQGHLKDLDVKELSKYVDWFGIMAYDFCMGSSAKTCHHSLLASADKGKSSGQSATEWYVANGASKNQIVLGVPFYGYQWKVRSINNHGIGQEIVKSAKPDDYDGFTQYRDILRLKSKFQPFWDDEVKQPWLVDPSEKIVVGYEDEASLRIKSKFVNEMDYGGIMIWELPYDSEDRRLLRVIAGSLKAE